MLRVVVLYLIRAYQQVLSPLFGPTCRFYPTCSQYGHLAISRYGVTKGLWFLLKRILRCHPFSPGGYDPLHPERLWKERSS